MTAQVSNPNLVAGSPVENQLSIFVIVVLYQMRPEQSPTLTTLQASLEAMITKDVRLAVAIADNTPGGQAPNDLPLNAMYEAFPDNPGLAKPYNQCLERAAKQGFAWILTLDQDTQLPLRYLEDLARYARQYGSDSSVGAIVPHIEDECTPVSPFRFVGGFYPRVVEPGMSGVLGEHASALNSASLLRIAALELCGGYDERFPLNNSDTALFERLDRHGFRIVVMGDLVVKHELAIMRRKERMAPQRYKQLLQDERNFWDLYMGPLGRAERLGRLLGRLLKGIGGRELSVFQELTFAEVKIRLFSRRRTRVKVLQRNSAPTSTLLAREL